MTFNKCILILKVCKRKFECKSHIFDNITKTIKAQRKDKKHAVFTFIILYQVMFSI